VNSVVHFEQGFHLVAGAQFIQQSSEHNKLKTLFWVS